MTAIRFFVIVATEGRMASCQTCGSRSSGLFCNSTSESIAAIDQHKICRTHAAGEYLFHEGDALSGLYCIQNGAVKLESESAGGNVHLLHVVEKGDVLGYKALLDGGVFHCSAIALKDTESCFIPRQVFMKLLESDPSVAIAAIRTLSAEVHALETRLCHATDLSATERVAEALLMLKDKWEERNWKRKELADWAGTTEETVIRALGQFASDGLIVLEGRKVTITDRRGLLERARIVV